MQIPVPASHNSILDYVIVALLAIISTLGSVAWYFILKQMSTYDSAMSYAARFDAKISERVTKIEVESGAHRDDDNRRFGIMETDITSIERTHETTGKTLRWLGDCMIRLGTSQGVDLPPRPD